MVWIFRILAFLIGFASLWGVVFLVLTTYGWEKVWEARFGSPDLGTVQFEDFAKGPLPNQALACPNGVCRDGDRDIISLRYGLSVDELRIALLTALDQEDSLERVDDGKDPLRLRFVQRTRLLRFPDTIRVQLFSLDAQTTTIALYSQSQVGVDDFGINKARLQRWLSRLKQYELTGNISLLTDSLTG